jgi:hypothetical protein
MSDKEVQQCVARAEAEYEWMKDKIHDQYEEIERLKDLCNKYEEEHNTTFNYWKELIKEDYKTRIDEAIDFLKEYHNYENRFKWCEQDYIQTINQVEKILKGE